MAAPQSTGTRAIDIDVTGMTCASCAARVEKRLNKIDGVAAVVNYATEKASVSFPATVSPDDLAGAIRSAGYGAVLPPPVIDDVATARDQATLDAGHDAELRSLRRRVKVSAWLTVPVVLVSMIPVFDGPGWKWFAVALATPVATWGAWPFHRAAALNLRHGATTMDTLVSMGVSAAYGWSLVALIRGSTAHLYVEVACVVTVFLLLGRYWEARARRRSGDALRALLDLGAKEATRLDGDGREVRIPASSLLVGDRFVVRPGEKIATDAVVLDGSSAVDASMLTGESVPVEVGPGATVAGATLNAGGRLVLQATAVGADTQLAQIIRMVNEAQAGKAPVQRLADRISAVFVPIVLVLAAATLLGWLWLGDSGEAAVSAAVSVLVIACPCALGLATPTALLVGTGRGAQLGILIRGPEVLEDTRRVDTVVLDKTGTVTTGRMQLVAVVPAADVDADDLLVLAAGLEHAAEHPIGRAIAAAGAEHVASGALPPVTGFTATPGQGAVGEVDGHRVAVGRAGWVEETVGAVMPADLEVLADLHADQGRTVVVAGVDGHIHGLLVVSDVVRPSSAEAVARLRGLGLHPVLLTGDREVTARTVAAEIGVDTVIAEVLPADKVAVVTRLRQEGRVVAMIGDGINDAAALVAADLGLAMGTGTDAAMEAADLTLVRPDLLAAVDAISLSRATLRTIKANLFWAFAYNALAIPLAMAGLLDPMIAAGAMAFSSVFVVTNSLRLRRFRSVAATVVAPAD